MTPYEFLTAKMILFMRWPGRETSGYRSPRVGLQIDPATPQSPHGFWMGTDYVPVAWGEYGKEQPRILPEFVAEAQRLGLKALLEKDHYHLQPMGWEAG